MLGSEELDLLEKRLETLENQVLLKGVPFDANQNRTITDLLLQTQYMISSALSCREAITSILQHMTTINDYLDPTHGENELEVEAKRHYLLELYPQLKDTIQLIGNFESLSSFVDSTSIMKVTDLYDKLEQLAVTNLNIYEENRNVTQNVLKSLQQYNDITTSLKVLFSQLDQAVTDLEVALQPKFVTEE